MVYAGGYVYSLVGIGSKNFYRFSPPLEPVGGEVLPINNVLLLAPYVAVIFTVVTITAIFKKRM